MVKKSLFYMLAVSVLVSFVPLACPAQNGWVSDMLLLTFRQGPGNSYTVLKTLSSNTPVVILDEQNNFFKVELQSKEIGWVDKKFIIVEPPKAVLLEQANRKITVLENRITKLTTDIQAQKDSLLTKESEYSNQIDPLKSSLKSAQEENGILKTALSDTREKYNTLVDQSKNIQKIIKENKSLLQENTTLSTELKSLRVKNKNLFKTAMIKWFLAGVGILLLGWLIGQGVSSKKRRYGSLLD